MKVVVLTPEELKTLFINSLHEFGLVPAEKSQKTYTINEVAKKLGMAHATVRRLVENGVIRSTPNKRIPEQAVEDFLAGIPATK
jgi:excisionase family DNA binding protein